MNEKADDLAMGGASSFDEYQKMVGVIEGLAVAEREILDLMEKQRKAEDGSDGYTMVPVKHLGRSSLPATWLTNAQGGALPPLQSKNARRN